MINTPVSTDTCRYVRQESLRKSLTENESSFMENIPHTPPGPLGSVPNLVYLSTPRGEGLQRSRLAHLASPSTQAGRLQPTTHVLISHCDTGHKALCPVSRPAGRPGNNRVPKPCSGAIIVVGQKMPTQNVFPQPFRSYIGTKNAYTFV